MHLYLWASNFWIWAKEAKFLIVADAGNETFEGEDRIEEKLDSYKPVIHKGTICSWTLTSSASPAQVLNAWLYTARPVQPKILQNIIFWF